MPVNPCRASIVGATLLVCCLSSVAFVAIQNQNQSQTDAADAARLIEVLEIQPGSTVADIGAGGGALVPAIARRVGATGRLYATDINADRLTDLKKVTAANALENVIVLQGAADETKLPEGCCDAVYMRLVYHHFGDPPAMNASLFRSLKPGGRIAVLEFKPTSGKSAPPGKRNEGDAHGVMPDTVVEELKAAGFADVRIVPWVREPTVAIVGRRPGS
jgi:ubiquinone/menaquinone biosynthesis C-methylase UbiE